MRFSRHQLFALVLGAGMATALPAQTRQRPPRPDRQGQANRPDSLRGPGMRRPPGPAAMLLNERDKLSLSAEQIASLQALESQGVAGEPAPADMMRLRQELMSAVRGDANIDAARAAFTKLNQLQTEAFVARLEARNQARAVLTLEQRAQLDVLEAERPAALAGLMGGMAGPPGAGGRGGPAGARGPRRGAGAPPAPPPPPAAR